jgi:hypothetical protein
MCMVRSILLKLFTIFILGGITWGNLMFSQSPPQMKKFIIPPYIVNMVDGSKTQLPSYPTQDGMLSNGMFDQAGNLMFYVIYDKVYDASGTIIGNLWCNCYMSEISICNVPGSCDKFYIIYALSCPYCNAQLYYSIVKTSITAPNTYQSTMLQTNVEFTGSFSFFETAGLALSRARSDNSRFLYVVGNNIISKYFVSANGIFPLFYFTPTDDYFHYNLSEVELSPDQSKLAWGVCLNDGRVNFIGLDLDGNFVLPIKSYTIPNSNNSINGLEFSLDSKKLYVISNVSNPLVRGINVINMDQIPISHYHVPNSSNVSYSQLELSVNGKMYFLNGNFLSSIDPNNNDLVTPNELSLPGVILSQCGDPTLPDQIDGENYSTISSCVPDLWIKDTPSDVGLEPNPDNNPMWLSEDIWVKHLSGSSWIDGAQYGVANKVFVKVRNRGNSTGAGSLHLYWAKGSTSLSWPAIWTGGNMWGGELTTTPIPISVSSNTDITIEIPWNNVPNPNNYNTDPHHFCLLARIETPEGMTYPEVSNVDPNTKNNNNIAWRNITILSFGKNLSGVLPTAITNIRNVSKRPVKTKITFKIPKNTQNSILKIAEVSMVLEKSMAKNWKKNGSIGSGFRLKNDTTLILLKPETWIENIQLEPNEIRYVKVIFKLNQNIKIPRGKFNFDIIQADNVGKTYKEMGGVRFSLIDTTRIIMKSIK